VLNGVKTSSFQSSSIVHSLYVPSRLLDHLKANSITAVLTAAVLGALLLQLNLLSGQLELQRQQFEQQVGTDIYEFE